MNLGAERGSAWITSAEDELYSIGCDKPILTHLARYSNLLDNEFDGNYGIEDIGLPDGVTQQKFEECVDYIFEKRILELYNDTPEVIAFYVKYEDAQVSVRDDHVSYFAGNEDDFRVRMNLYFDENYNLDHNNFHCYVERELQHEVAQEDIINYLQNYECEK